VTARTDDYDEIVRVMQLYVDRFNDLTTMMSASSERFTETRRSSTSTLRVACTKT
jgi:hypothetical protein